MSDKIAVVGGTGMLGWPAASALAEQGFEVRIISRKPEGVEKLLRGPIEVVRGDVTDYDSLREVFEDCRAVYINLSANMNFDDFERIEHQGTLNAARAASEVGVDQIGMISILDAGQQICGNVYIDTKTRAEQALMDCGVPYSIFRCCWFFESLPKYVVNNRAMMFGKQPHKLSWMAAADYGNMVVKAFQSEAAKNRIFHIRGIEKYTLGEALRIFGDIVHPGMKIARTPLWMVKAIGNISRNKLARGMAQFASFYENNPETAREDDTEKILGPALTTLVDWSEEYKKRLVEAQYRRS